MFTYLEPSSTCGVVEVKNPMEQILQDRQLETIIRLKL
jgi:hypothetical protein